MIDLIHHVGIVVHSADRALEFFRDTMKLEVTADKVIEEQGVRGVLLAVGENEIELLEPTRADTGVARYLERRVKYSTTFVFEQMTFELNSQGCRGVV